MSRTFQRDQAQRIGRINHAIVARDMLTRRRIPCSYPIQTAITNVIMRVNNHKISLHQGDHRLVAYRMRSTENQFSIRGMGNHFSSLRLGEGPEVG